jgi:hypothetical protein
MSEKGNPLEGLFDMINKVSKDQGQSIDMDTLKEQMNSIMNEDSLKNLMKGTGLGSTENLLGMAKNFDISSMLNNVMSKRMNRGAGNVNDDIEKMKSDIQMIKKYIKSNNWEQWY